MFFALKKKIIINKNRVTQLCNFKFKKKRLMLQISSSEGLNRLSIGKHEVSLLTHSMSVLGN